jgi:hypothetical protein
MVKRLFGIIMIVLLVLLCSGTADHTASGDPKALAVVKWRENLAFYLQRTFVRTIQSRCSTPY